MTERRNPSNGKHGWLSAAREVVGTLFKDFSRAMNEAFNTGIPSMALGSFGIVVGGLSHDPLQMAGAAGLVALGGIRAGLYYKTHHGAGLGGGPKG